MTILDNGTRNQYTATGGQTVFIYDFEIFESGDIVVYRNTDLLSIGTDYTLTGVGNDNGGTVVLTSGATAGHVYTIFRQTAPERITDYQQSGDFLAEEINNDLDRIWAVIQELESAQNRFFQVSELTQANLPVTLEDPVTNQYLRWKNENTIESVALSTFPSGTAVQSDFAQSVSDYTALIALNPADLVDGQTIVVTNAGIAGSGNIRKVVGHGFTSTVGVIVRIDNDTYWERDYSGLPSAKWWGVFADNVTDISSEINLALLDVDSLLIPDDDNEYFINAGSLNVLTGKMLVGQSKEGTKLRFSSAQLDCITSAGNMYLANMTINGGWDGATPAQAGDLIRVDSASFISQVTLKNLKLLNAKQDSVRLSNLGYSSIEDVQSNVSGRMGLHLDGENAKTNTTIKLSGRNVFSDCPNGFGVRVYDGHNCDLGNVICEYTAGIEIAGNNNRALNFDGAYQEFGSGSDAYTFTGAGIGLTITNNFGGGLAIPNAANFTEVTMFGNSNFSSIAPIQVNDLVVISGTRITSSGTAQTSVTLGSETVQAGLYEVSCDIVYEDAGSANITNVAGLITTNGADSAYQLGTVTVIDLADYDEKAGGGNRRLRISGFLSLTSSTVVYMRAGYQLSAGQVTFNGTARLKRVK